MIKAERNVMAVTLLAMGKRGSLRRPTPSLYVSGTYRYRSKI